MAWVWHSMCVRDHPVQQPAIGQTILWDFASVSTLCMSSWSSPIHALPGVSLETRACQNPYSRHGQSVHTAACVASWNPFHVHIGHTEAYVISRTLFFLLIFSTQGWLECWRMSAIKVRCVTLDTIAWVCPYSFCVNCVLAMLCAGHQWAQVVSRES